MKIIKSQCRTKNQITRLKACILCIYTFITITFHCETIYAQQFRQQGLYMLDPYHANPAFGGFNNALTLNGNFRRQWANFEGAPVSQYISAHMPLRSINSGTGMVVHHEKLGATEVFTGEITYNYIFTQFQNFILSAGTGIGIRNNKINGDELLAPDGIYDGPSNHLDPLIPNNPFSTNNVVLQGGISVRTPNAEGGIGLNQIVHKRLTNRDEYPYTPTTHINAYGSYYLKINSDIHFSPSFFVKYDLRTVQSEIDLHVYYQNMFGGIGVRGYSSKSFDGIKIILGGRLNEKLMVAYNFESTLSGLQSVSGGTYELSLQYRIPLNFMLPAKEKIIYHPRM